MRKIILVLIVISAASLLSSCCGRGTCANVNTDNCCGSSGNGNWY